MDIFAVIADPTRRIMLKMMITGERAAGEFVAAFPKVSQPAISQHLKVLRDTGMVIVRADRQKRFYALQPDGLEAFRNWLSAFAAPSTPEKAPEARKSPPKPAAKPKAPEPATLDLFG